MEGNLILDKKRDAPALEGVIIGRNAVREALNSGREIDSIYLKRSEDRSGSILPIIAKAKEKGIVIKEVDGKKLDYMCGGANHQGIAASVAVKAYSSLEDVLSLAKARGEPPFIIVCDELSDPQNLGAILRTAECAGVHGVILPKRHSAGLSYAVGKASAGAVEYIHVVKVTNLTSTIRELKEQGLWIYAADMQGQDYCQVDYKGPAAIVIGSEGGGISRLVKEQADFTVRLPMKGKISSLNASVAAGVICYEVMRQRSGLHAINP